MVQFDVGLWPVYWPWHGGCSFLYFDISGPTSNAGADQYFAASWWGHERAEAVTLAGPGGTVGLSRGDPHSGPYRRPLRSAIACRPSAVAAGSGAVPGVLGGAIVAHAPIRKIGIHGDAATRIYSDATQSQGVGVRLCGAAAVSGTMASNAASSCGTVAHDRDS